jgi:HK97 family phage prohead protease
LLGEMRGTMRPERLPPAPRKDQAGRLGISWVKKPGRKEASMRKVPEVGKTRRAPFLTELRSINDEKRTIEFVASDETVDRYGDVIRTSGWKVDNYLRNPVFLWGHKSTEPPIGKTVKLSIEKTPPALVQMVEFATDPFSDRIFQLYKGGFLRAVSVGFRPTKTPKAITDEESGRITGYEFDGTELLELSGVSIPANPSALARAVEGGVITKEIADEMAADFERMQEDLDADESAAQEQTDEAMVMCNKKATESEENVKNDTQERLSDVIARVCGGRGSENQRPELEKFAEAVKAEIKVQFEVLLATVRAGQESCFERIEKKIDEVVGEAQSVDDPIAAKGTAWDAGAEMAKQITPAGWKRMCTVIVGDPALKGSYKLPHHRGDGFEVVPNGVRVALDRFEATNMPSADRARARNHLIKHQKKIAIQQGWDFDENAFEKKLAGLGDIYRNYQKSCDSKSMESVDALIHAHVEGIFPKPKDPLDEFVEEIWMRQP